MQCAEIKKQILTYAGGREAVPREIQDHVKSCTPCRRQWERVAGVWDLLGEHPTIEPAGDFLTRIRRRILEGPWWRILVPVGVAAAAVLALVFALPKHEETLPGPENPPVVQLSQEDKEILENLDLLENYELIQALEAVDEDFTDFLEDEEGGD